MLAIVITLHKMELGACTVDQLGEESKKKPIILGICFAALLGCLMLSIFHIFRPATVEKWRVCSSFSRSNEVRLRSMI